MSAINTPQPKWLPLKQAVFRFANLGNKRRQTKLPRRAPVSLDEITEILRKHFDHAVMAGAVVLYARPAKLTAEFVRIPADAWAMLKVIDCKNGVAIAPDGTRYWSVHAVAATNADPVAVRDKGGAPPKYDYDMTRGEAFRLFRAHGLPDRDGDEGWQTRADLERCLAEFCAQIHGNEPTKSTLQGFAKRAIADWEKAEADKADNRLSAITGRCRPTKASGRGT
jgi:hypothetical protein